jgi:hypothetical protein
MQEVYAKYSMPDGNGDKGTAHSYIEHYYAKKFAPYRYQPIAILEIGISWGMSINMWREYFPNATIYGVDILDQGAECPGCTLVYGDGTKAETYANMPDFDIIIDDGSHEVDDQIASFKVLYPKLKKGGLYVIEDVPELDRYRSRFLELDDNVEIYDFRNLKGRIDDIIIEIVK